MAAGSLRLAFRRDHLRVFVHKQVHYPYRLIHNPAAVAAQVDDKPFDMLVVIEVIHGSGEVPRGVLRKLAERDIPAISLPLQGGVGGGLNGCIVIHRVEVYILAGEGFREGFFHSLSLQHQRHGRARHTAQVIAYLAHRLPLGADAIHGDDSVACPHAVALRGLALVGIGDEGLPLALFVGVRMRPRLLYRHLPLLYQCPDAAVLPLRHHTQVVVFLLGEIDGIGVHLAEHSVDGGLGQLLIVQRICIVHIQLPEHIAEDSERFVHPCCLLLRRNYCARADCYDCGKEITCFHKKCCLFSIRCKGTTFFSNTQMNTKCYCNK